MLSRQGSWTTVLFSSKCTPSDFPHSNDESAHTHLSLSRHEIAFIMGQLSHPHSIPALLEVLERTDESPMVRHEAAEALGGITEEGSDSQATLQILREWSNKPGAPEVVKESCIVAVDMWNVCLSGLSCPDAD